MAARLRTLQLGGLESLASLSSSPLLPSAYGLGRMMRFCSELSDLAKPTLGVDIGASATTLAVASADDLQLSVYRSLGMGASLSPALQQIRLEDITRWVPFEIPDSEVRDYLYQKSMFPAMLPMTPETLAIEQAMVRQILRSAVCADAGTLAGDGAVFRANFCQRRAAGPGAQPRPELADAAGWTAAGGGKCGYAGPAWTIPGIGSNCRFQHAASSPNYRIRRICEPGNGNLPDQRCKMGHNHSPAENHVRRWERYAGRR